LKFSRQKIKKKLRRAKERKISKRKGDNEESTRHEGEDLDGSSSPTSAVSGMFFHFGINEK